MTPNKPQKTYYDGFHIVLTTENGVSVLKAVYLEDQVLDAFMKYVEKIYGVKITVEKRKEDTDVRPGQQGDPGAE